MLKKMRMLRYFLFLIFLSLQVPVGAQAFGNDGPVHFVVHVSSKMFAERTPVRVQICIESKLKQPDSGANCEVRYDPQTKTERFVCRPPEHHRGGVPEIFVFDSSTMRPPLEVVSHLLKRGEEYRVRISGRASDGCNTVSTEASGRVETDNIVIDNLQWAVTELACPPGTDAAHPGRHSLERNPQAGEPMDEMLINDIHQAGSSGGVLPGFPGRESGSGRSQGPMVETP